MKTMQELKMVPPIFIGRWTPKVLFSLKEKPYRHGQLRRHIGVVSQHMLTSRPLKNWLERANSLLSTASFCVVSLFRAGFCAIASPYWPSQRQLQTPRPGLTAQETRQPSGFACAPGCRPRTRT